MANNHKSEFGWGAVLRHYGFKSLLKDSVLPLCLSITILFLITINEVDVKSQLEKLLSIGFTIVPVMISLVLAAYAILLSYILSESVSKIIENDSGRDFIADLNSGFAAYLFISIITIVVMIVVSNVLEIGIECRYGDLINAMVYGIISFLLLYSVNVLIGVVIDIFNIGQTRTIK